RPYRRTTYNANLSTLRFDHAAHPERVCGRSGSRKSHKEVYRVAKLGLRGLELSCSWDMEPMWHPVWEPLWKAVNDVQLPLHFHTFPAMPASVRESLSGDLRRKAQFTSVAGFQMNLINIIA